MSSQRSPMAQLVSPEQTDKVGPSVKYSATAFTLTT